MNSSYTNRKKNRSIVLNIVKEKEYNYADTETLKDEEIAYFIKKNSKSL